MAAKKQEESKATSIEQGVEGWDWPIQKLKRPYVIIENDWVEKERSERQQEVFSSETGALLYTTPFKPSDRVYWEKRPDF